MTDDRLRLAQLLTAITDMHQRLGDEALHARINETSMYIPGGDALNMLGPAANLQAWEYRYEAAEAAGMTIATDYAYDQIDHEDHPLLVLASWEDTIRDELGQPTDLKATVQRAADYLRNHIDYLCDNWLPIDALIHDLYRVKNRLETILHDGIRPDRGVPCMECGTLLVKIWGDAVDGSDDKWHCSTCETWSNVEQYTLAVTYAARAHAKGLTASDMEDEYRIRPGTLRVWASRGLVKKRGKDSSGRQLYDVQDALNARENADVANVS